MRLNGNEKAELISALKKHYNEGKMLVESDNLPYWLKDKELREIFINRNEELRLRYEALENEIS